MTSTENIHVPDSLIDAVNALPDAAFLVGVDGVIVAVNNNASSVFGYSRSQLVGSSIDELMPESARGYHEKARESYESERKPRQFSSGRTFECERRDGSVFQADIVLSPTKIEGVPMTWALVRDLDQPTDLNAGRRQAMVALDTIGHMAASTFDLDKDFATVAERLQEVVPHDRIGLALLCEDDQEMVEIVFLAGDDHPLYKQGERVPRSSSTVGWVSETRAHVSFKKSKTEFAPPAILAGFKKGYTEVCAAPLFDGDSIIGSLVLSTREARGFSEFQKSLIARLANHLSVSVVNGRMREKLQAQVHETELISEIGQLISASPDLESAFSLARNSIIRLVHCDRFAIYKIDLNESVITRMFETGDRLPGFDQRIHALPGKAAESIRAMFAIGQPVQFDQEMIATAAEEQPSFRPYRDAGYRWALIVPLIVIQQPVGMVVLGSKRKEGFSQHEIALAGRIGEQLAGPIANSFHLSRTEDEARTESILAEIRTMVDSMVDLQTSENELGSLIRQLVPNNSITISSVTSDGAHLKLVYKDFSGIDKQDGWEVGAVKPWKGTTAEQIFVTRKPVVVNADSWQDFRTSFPGAAPVHSGDLPKSVINVPLVTNDEIFGFLTLRSVKKMHIPRTMWRSPLGSALNLLHPLRFRNCARGTTPSTTSERFLRRSVG